MKEGSKNGELARRTRGFALDIIRFVEALPPGKSADTLGRQLLRAATSVGANYRAACRARSTADFLNKLGIVEEEADECEFWLGLMRDAQVAETAAIDPLSQEADELTAMVVASIKSVRRRPS